jgi:hypothetical protein
MSDNSANRFLKVESVLSDHGGNVAFWSRWLAGEVSPAVMDWMRGQVSTHPGARRWLDVVENPHAHKARAFALEIVNYLVEDPVPSQDDELTDLITASVTVQGGQSVRERLRHCLFELLDEVEIPRPPDQSVQKEATALLSVLVGAPAVRAFQTFGLWLDRVRGRMAMTPTKLDRLLAWLTPELVEEQGSRPRYRLSYRLLMRERFYLYAVKQAWEPEGPRFRDLESAFEALSRERIGELAKAALAESEFGPLRYGWQLAYAEFAA